MKFAWTEKGAFHVIHCDNHTLKQQFNHVSFSTLVLEVQWITARF